jgi:hypothetical protein
VILEPLGYALEMREEVLKQYFLHGKTIRELADDLRGSVSRLDAIASSVKIMDMQDSFLVESRHALMLCDEFLSNNLGPEEIETIAFALIASDRFEWKDEILSEVIHDWSAPEINFPLNHATIQMHRDWLTGASVPAPRPSLSSYGKTRRVISRREKVSI